MKPIVTRILFSFLIVALSLPVLAQTDPQQPPPPPPPAEDKKDQAEPQQPKLTEEMVVTARKREETVADVPISVAAPSEQRLRDAGAETIEDIAANVAGFAVQNLGPGQSQVAMRGVSAGQIVRDQPGVKEQVGVYLDESVISLSLFTPDIDLFDMNRVEVLRGPQGTLFGSGSLSGTVRYISNLPKLETSETVGELGIQTISDGGVGGSLKAAVNVPLGPVTALRFVGSYTNYGGFIDAVQPNLRVNEDVNDGHRIGGRVALLYQPSDKFRVIPRVLVQEIKMNGWNRIDAFNILANPYTTTRPQVTLGGRSQFTQFKEPYTDDFLLGDLQIEYDLGFGRLTSISSYTDRDVLVVRDATALTASITGGSIGLPENVYTLDAPLDDSTRAKGWTQELRVAGNHANVDWVAGFFYSDMDREYGQRLIVNRFEALTGIPTAGNFGAIRDELFHSALSYDYSQFALFTEGTWKATPRFDLTGGVRWYHYDEDRIQTFDGIFADPGTTSGSVKADGFAPRVIASFKATPNLSINGQISKGFRLGGINDPLNVPLCTPQDLVTFGGRDTWDDEELWNYEVGTKGTIAGGRGAFNVAAFQANIENLQATVTAGSCSSRVIFNVPKARSRGVEAELELAPTDHFDFAISVAKYDSKLRSTLTSTDPSGNVSVVAGIEKGNRLPTVPDNQLAAATTYRWDFRQNVAGYLTGVYQHVGGRYTQIGDQAEGFGTVNLLSFAPNNIGGPYTQNTFQFDPRLPSYDLVNLRFGILRGNWDTALFVNNLTDERALLALDQERGTRARVGYLTNQPRTFGVSARVTF